jgi:hypothetical protein
VPWLQKVEFASKKKLTRRERFLSETGFRRRPEEHD